MEEVLSIVLGISLASAVGFRVFIPFLVISLAGYFNFFELNENWQWIGTPSAIITFSVATLVEILAYFIPFVDNLLDTIAVPIAGIAGAVIMLSTIGEFNPLLTYTLAILAGGGTAAMVKSATSTSRLASTAVTAGIGNPVVSTIESFFSTILSLSAIFVPFLAVLLLGFVFYLLYKIFRKTVKVVQ